MSPGFELGNQLTVHFQMSNFPNQDIIVLAVHFDKLETCD